MKWRRCPPLPPPELVLKEQVGPFEVEVTRTTTLDDGDGRTFETWHARYNTKLNTSVYLTTSAKSAQDALLKAARKLGFEPDDGAR